MHTQPPVMLTGPLAFPGGYVMFAAEFSFLCESPTGGRTQQAGRIGPLTQQQQVFEYVPRGCRSGLDRLCESTNHNQQRLSLPWWFFHLFVFFFSMPKVQMCSDTSVSDSATFILLSLMFWIILSHAKGNNSFCTLFICIFCCCFYFLYRWQCILHVFTLFCPSQKGEIILTHLDSLHHFLQ